MESKESRYNTKVIAPRRDTPCERLWKARRTALACRELSKGEEDSSWTPLRRSQAAGRAEGSGATRGILELGSGPRPSLQEEGDLERKRKNLWSFEFAVSW